MRVFKAITSANKPTDISGSSSVGWRRDADQTGLRPMPMHRVMRHSLYLCLFKNQTHERLGHRATKNGLLSQMQC